MDTKAYELGFYINDLFSGRVWMHNADHLFPLASIAKMVAVIISCHLTDHLSPNLIDKAISEHSNDAYQAILDICGEEAINDYLRDHDFNLVISKNNRDEHHNCGTPESLAKLLETEVLKYERPLYPNIILESLKKQTDHDGFRIEKMGKWAHMTGGLDTLCADAGILIKNGNPIIFVGFAQAIQKNVEWQKLEYALYDVGQRFLNGTLDIG